jgi:hypothetical protein
MVPIPTSLPDSDFPAIERSDYSVTNMHEKTPNMDVVCVWDIEDSSRYNSRVRILLIGMIGCEGPEQEY